MKNNKRGFTLIELLVVVAIIGILASIVLASLNSAREKGGDAAVKASLANTRAQAELFYDDGLSYDGVCATSGTHTIGSMVGEAERAYGNLTPTTYDDATASEWNTGQCHDSSGAWAAIVPLKASLSGAVVAWCVDSTGASKEVNVVLAALADVCP